MTAVDRPVRPEGDGVPPVWWSPSARMMFVQHFETVYDDEGNAVAELPADAVRLVPAGGSAPADELEFTRDDIERVAAEWDRAADRIETIGEDDVARDHARAGIYRACAVTMRHLVHVDPGGSAPHQGATTDVTAPRELLESMLDTDPCWFDHNGGCQAHGYLSLEQGEVCPQAELKALLGAGGTPDETGHHHG